MKLSIDGALCRGHGRCYNLAEDLLEDDDDGFVTARGQVVDVPPTRSRTRATLRARAPKGRSRSSRA